MIFQNLSHSINMQYYVFANACSKYTHKISIWLFRLLIFRCQNMWSQYLYRYSTIKKFNVAWGQCSRRMIDQLEANKNSITCMSASHNNLCHILRGTYALITITLPRAPNVVILTSTKLNLIFYIQSLLTIHSFNVLSLP